MKLINALGDLGAFKIRDLQILAVLHDREMREQPTSSRDIDDVMGFRAYYLVRRLVNVGLIERMHDSDEDADWRTVYLKLSDRGRAKYRKLTAAFAEVA